MTSKIVSCIKSCFRSWTCWIKMIGRSWKGTNTKRRTKRSTSKTLWLFCNRKWLCPLNLVMKTLTMTLFWNSFTHHYQPFKRRKSKGEAAKTPNSAISMDSHWTPLTKSYNKVSTLLMSKKMTVATKYKCKRRK